MALEIEENQREIRAISINFSIKGLAGRICPVTQVTSSSENEPNGSSCESYHHPG
jgi:hypothetical protein